MNHNRCHRWVEGRRALLRAGISTAALGLALFMAGCVTAVFEPPVTIDEPSLRDRSTSVSGDGILVSVAIPSREESLAIFGVDLAGTGIDPVWIEIENTTERRMYFMPTGLDPNYFSPLEVAFKFHKKFGRGSRTTVGDHLEQLGFSPLLDPRTTESGFVYTNAGVGDKFITVDLVGKNWAKSFSLVASRPGSAGEEMDRFRDRLRRMEFADVEDESSLRQLLEQAPCCVTGSSGASGESLNLVLIGSFEHIAAGFVRRSFHLAPVAPMVVFERPQDFSIRKVDLWEAAQPHIVRLWLTDIRYRGEMVWIGQVSMPVGGRFAEKLDDSTNLSYDPEIDLARNDIVQEMIYSQSLVKFGFVNGVGRVTPPEPRTSLGGRPYETDGLRAVMFFGREASSISDIEYLNWESLVDGRKESMSVSASAASP